MGITVDSQFNMGYIGYYRDGSCHYPVSWGTQLPQYSVCSLWIAF